MVQLGNFSFGILKRYLISTQGATNGKEKLAPEIQGLVEFRTQGRVVTNQ